MRYVGRMLGIGLNNGKPFAFYRLNSRSFPNRKAVVRGGDVFIVNQEETDNPYVSYPVVKLLEGYVVVSNGLQTTFIAQALEWESPKKALIHVLDAFDYERDDYNTPRIAGIVERGKVRGWLGFVGRDELWVKGLKLREGMAFFTATYNVDGVEEIELSFSSAKELVEKVLSFKFTHAVLAIGVVEKEKGWEIAVGP
ncbi:IMP cyclohydrolase [Pyrococcus yayanosii]|uniref:IMP cyclohydrolase n=1 Tax=Pyrococcus yayanosii (strain CH1 / JCM 16557) TaxID=529709 RepID=F8AI85_PYRYC|nr:IMP cyclohydrolase [Pyrococcus yayanosii]AEH24316.1 IMP cyclohydrolase [Pyrococcus yayanosii CH1]